MSPEMPTPADKLAGVQNKTFVKAQYVVVYLGKIIGSGAKARN